MIRSAITTIILMALSAIPTAWAYSLMQNLDGWDAGQLKDAGITVSAWKHEEIAEVPALHWVKDSYDWTKRRGDPDVLMTLYLAGDDGQAQHPNVRTPFIPNQ